MDKHLRSSEIAAVEAFCEKLERRMQHDLRALEKLDPLVIHMAWLDAIREELLALSGRKDLPPHRP